MKPEITIEEHIEKEYGITTVLSVKLAGKENKLELQFTNDGYLTRVFIEKQEIPNKFTSYVLVAKDYETYTQYIKRNKLDPKRFRYAPDTTYLFGRFREQVLFIEDYYARKDIDDFIKVYNSLTSANRPNK